MNATIPPGADVLKRIDEAKLSRLRWKIMFISGMGFFTDYPVSSIIMSEYASKKTRGMMVMLVFTMQAGLVFGPLLAAALLTTHLSHDLIWRLLLAFGAVPAMAVFQMRRHMAETPRYLLATEQHDAFARPCPTFWAKSRAKGRAVRSPTGRRA